MPKLRLRHLWTALVLLLVLGFGLVAGWNRLFAPPPAAPVASAAQPLATINGVAITPQMVERELKISRLNVASPLPPLSGEDLARAQEEALNQLLSRQLILQAAAQQGFSLDDEFIAQRADLLFGSYGEEALDQALAQAGATRADMLWWVEEIFTVEAFTTEVIMAQAAPEERQQVYNEWLNTRRAEAQIQFYEDGQQQTVTQALVGQAAPDFTLATPDGRPVSLSDYAGQVVLVNFWATWCPSCVTEMPDYEQVYQQYGPEFVVLGVNLQESPAHVQQYAAGLGVTFPVLVDAEGAVTTRQYQVTGMPGSFLIDREGRIHYRHLGPMSADTLTQKLAELGL